MTDRELLELAARAAGVDVDWNLGQPERVLERWDGNPSSSTPWNPLTDDGDALRLAVKLEMNLGIFGDGDGAIAVIHDANGRVWIDCRDQAPDPYTATRRAIVLCAAERGKAMGASEATHP